MCRCLKQVISTAVFFNTLRPRQNGRHFADNTFKRIFMNENVRISINISLKFVSKCLIKNIPALVQIMAWRRPGDKPLSEPMIINLLTHICILNELNNVNQSLSWEYNVFVFINCKNNENLLAKVKDIMKNMQYFSHRIRYAQFCVVGYEIFFRIKVV